MEEHHHATELARQAAERETHVEMVPGTEIMEDFSGVHLTHAGNNAQAVVLVPQPSADPTDPLNWKKWRKLLTITTLGMFTFLSCFPILAIGPLYPVLIAEWGVSFKSVSVLTGITAATYGTFNFVVVPCVDIFGRRPVLFICLTILLVANIWMAKSTSYDSALGARVLSGLGSSINECAMAIVVADIMFLHERGTYMGAFFFAYVGGGVTGPIISGVFGQQVSWRWFYNFCAISTGLCIVIIALFVPETRRIEKDYVYHTRNRAEDNPAVLGEKASAQTLDRAETDMEHVTSITLADEYVDRGSPSRRQFYPWQKVSAPNWMDVARRFAMPWLIFLFPIPLWANLVATCAINCMLAVNLLQSQALGAPPYNWGAQSVGFSNFSILVGQILGLAVAGPFSDWVAMRATRKNNGIREPEMRLISMAPFIVLCIVGNLIVGIGFDRQWPWQAPVVLGFFLIGIVSVALQTIPVTYAVDCYKTQAGAIFAQTTVTRNAYGLGMTLFINDWAFKSGYLPPLAMQMGVTVGLAVAGMIVFPIWGKSIRRFTKDSFIHKM